MNAVSSQPTPLNALIVDDEPFVRADLIQMLVPHREISVKGEAGSVDEARELLGRRRFDVVFLDIHLRGGNGFDLVPNIPLDTKVVFITAHEQHAVRAFEVNALDYLVKPVAADRLAKSIERILKSTNDAEEDRPNPKGRFDEDDTIMIYHEEIRRFVPVRDIVVVNSVGGNYTTLALKNGEQPVIRRTFREWQDLLPFSCFTRVHRQCIVNLHHAVRLQRNNEGYWSLRMSGIPSPVAVSRRSVPAVKTRLEEIRAQELE